MINYSKIWSFNYGVGVSLIQFTYIFKQYYYLTFISFVLILQSLYLYYYTDFFNGDT